MAGNTKGTLVNRAGLADVFGVAVTTVDAWVRSGCPVTQRGSRGVEWQFNTADISRWLRDKSVADATGTAPADEAELDKRRRTADTLRAELELAKARGDVAPVRDFERAQAAFAAAIRANVMNVPARAVLQLLGETNERVFKDKLRAELVLALETAAAADLALDDDEEETDDANA